MTPVWKDFALVSAGLVIAVINTTDVTTYANILRHDLAIDVTAHSPVPAIGDAYDANTGNFTTPAAAEPDVVQSRATATKQINRECGEFRAQYITVIAAQETAYQYKSNECDRWDAMVAAQHDPTQSLAQFPFIVGEATVRGISPTAMRNLIFATRSAWEAMLLHSELKRQTMHEAVRVAANDAAVQALFPINWSAP